MINNNKYMKSAILSFSEIDKTKITLVGGKGENLGKLKGIEGINVPDGFCISTEVFERAVKKSVLIKELLDRLSFLQVENKDEIRELSKEIRTAIENLPVPQDSVELISHHIAAIGEQKAFAVRSSATAEDLPTASFAGQQDTFLNVIGKESIFEHISKCWASLFTERAIVYRLQNGFDHRKVLLSVVIQEMVFPHAAGIMFTADPITSNRKILSIDASFGLGEALVSGIVNADNYKVRDGNLIDKKVTSKELAIYAANGGGTKKQQIDPSKKKIQTLTDQQILQLACIGKKIEENFDAPQDIEWCLAGDKFYIVQSRPITTLYPLPIENDHENHVYISVGHQQMMTDAMKPLGLSFWLLTTPGHMRTAGGRLFADVTQMLASPASRNAILDMLGKFDPLVKNALTTVIERGDFIKSIPNDKLGSAPGDSHKAAPLPDYEALNEYDPKVVADLVQGSQTAIEALRLNIGTKSGSNLFDFILENIEELKKRIADPENMGVIMTAMNAAAWLNEKIELWLGDKNVADTISQSVLNNVTSEMGLELLNVADVIRPYPEVIEYLQQTKDDNFMDDLLQFYGGRETRDAIEDYLNKYGMRCAGEIDITRSRWIENPSVIITLILNHIKNFEPGSGKMKFEQGRQEAAKKEKEILDRLRQLPNGEQKALETKRMINVVRNLSGYREYPKYSIISRYWLYKQALIKEAERLVLNKVIRKKEDIYYLTFQEFREVVETNQIDFLAVNKRKDEYEFYEKLSPPRVMTSDGEMISGSYNREDLGPGVIVGLAVSSGIIEGRARVIIKMEDAHLEDGDILVTPFTDPSWTPLFVSLTGLVTEVGGLMTHGAVIAREYGLPAVVGVENATKLIKDGQRIRVNGSDGYIEIIEEI